MGNVILTPCSGSTCGQFPLPRTNPRGFLLQSECYDSNGVLSFTPKRMHQGCFRITLQTSYIKALNYAMAETLSVQI